MKKMHFFKKLHSVTPVQISNLRNEPFVLLSQFMENYISMPTSVIVLHKFKSKTYKTDGSDIRIKLGTEVLTDKICCKTLENDYASFFYYSFLSTNPMGARLSDCINKYVYLANIGEQDISEGDGDVMFEVSYAFYDITR